MTRGVNLYITWGTDIEKMGESACKRRRREAAIAEGKKPLTTIGGLRERRKLPQRGLENRSDFGHFMPKLGTFWDLVNLRFLTIKSKNSRLKKFLLTRSWIYETNIMF